VLRCKVCIPKRHLNGLVTHQLLHSSKVHTIHYEASRECMPQVVPAEVVRIMRRAGTTDFKTTAPTIASGERAR
jgi:hypothetical protein